MSSPGPLDLNIKGAAYYSNPAARDRYFSLARISQRGCSGSAKMSNCSPKTGQSIWLQVALNNKIGTLPRPIGSRPPMTAFSLLVRRIWIFLTCQFKKRQALSCWFCRFNLKYHFNRLKVRQCIPLGLPSGWLALVANPVFDEFCWLHGARDRPYLCVGFDKPVDSNVGKRSISRQN